MVLELFVPILDRFYELVKAPYLNTEMLWIALPLLITLVIVELYFGRYRGERLGWNTALTNTLVLIFVSLNLLQRIFKENNGNWVDMLSSSSFIIALVILVLGIILFFVDFFHVVPKSLAFIFSAHLPINITAYTAIVLVYNKLPLDINTILAWVMLMVVLGGIFFFIKLLEPKPKYDNMYFL